jgi:hypothetical protein
VNDEEEMSGSLVEAKGTWDCSVEDVDRAEDGTPSFDPL